MFVGWTFIKAHQSTQPKAVSRKDGSFSRDHFHGSERALHFEKTKKKQKNLSDARIFNEHFPAY